MPRLETFFAIALYFVIRGLNGQSMDFWWRRPRDVALLACLLFGASLFSRFLDAVFELFPQVRRRRVGTVELHDPDGLTLARWRGPISDEQRLRVRRCMTTVDVPVTVVIRND